VSECLVRVRGSRRVIRAISVVVAAAALARLFLLPASQRGDYSSLGQFVLALLTAVSGVVLWTLKNKADDPDIIERALDGMATAVQAQWHSAAVERGLYQVPPIDVRWTWSTARVAGPPDAALRSAAGRERFSPLPGAYSVGPNELMRGTVSDLHRIYAGLDSGRLLIMGEPGSGKSAALICLLLDATRHRAATPLPDRALVPVPVLLPLNTWSAEAESLHTWIIREVVEVYDAFGRGRTGRDRVAHALSQGRLAVYLDGLDELPMPVQELALAAISSQATFRLTLTSRSAEVTAASSAGHFVGAAAVELQPLGPDEITQYVKNSIQQPMSPQWDYIVRKLQDKPNNPLGSALRSPLYLSLMVTSYGASQAPQGLLQRDSFPDVTSVQDYLLDRVLPSLYQKGGSSNAKIDLHAAKVGLTVVADYMQRGGNGDLYWWNVERWRGRATRLIATSCLWAILAYLFYLNRSIAVVFAFVGALLWGYAEIRPPKPRRLTVPRYRAFFQPTVLVAGAVFSVISFILDVISIGGVNDYAGSARDSLVAGLAVTVFLGLIVSITGESVGGTTVLSPIASFRRDFLNLAVTIPMFAVTGYFIGTILAQYIVAAQGFATFQSQQGSYTEIHTEIGGLIIRYWPDRQFADGSEIDGPVLQGGWFGCAAGGLIALLNSSAVRYCFAAFFLHSVCKTPIRLLRFLEDARKRGVLRVVGPGYQFRHARLLDRLAANGAPKSSRTKRTKLRRKRVV